MLRQFDRFISRRRTDANQDRNPAVDNGDGLFGERHSLGGIHLAKFTPGAKVKQPVDALIDQEVGNLTHCRFINGSVTMKRAGYRWNNAAEFSHYLSFLFVNTHFRFCSPTHKIFARRICGVVPDNRRSYFLNKPQDRLKARSHS